MSSREYARVRPPNFEARPTGIKNTSLICFYFMHGAYMKKDLSIFYIYLLCTSKIVDWLEVFVTPVGSLFNYSHFKYGINIALRLSTSE